ncbi:hypothetical protein PMIN01_11123 [Paraphaeosphaeria minitans]|uniref:Uncharacterized protein n=1 Tax=Paraphaeosphaeria minitans TaxID=565426 RepID=A0A9P6GBG8_9PLEO|nr:hypothetical protein PMIN01_11123 [Paraphaeosphaeria minitans]
MGSETLPWSQSRGKTTPNSCTASHHASCHISCRRSVIAGNVDETMPTSILRLLSSGVDE